MLPEYCLDPCFYKESVFGRQTLTSKKAGLCLSQNPLETTSSQTFGAVLTPPFNSSHEMSCKSGSTLTSLNTLLSSSASRSLSSLWRWMTNQPVRMPKRDPHGKCPRKHIQRASQEHPSRTLVSKHLETHSCFKVHISNWQNGDPTRRKFLSGKVHSSQICFHRPVIELFTSSSISFRY